MLLPFLSSMMLTSVGPASPLERSCRSQVQAVVSAVEQEFSGSPAYSDVDYRALSGFLPDDMADRDGPLLIHGMPARVTPNLPDRQNFSIEFDDGGDNACADLSGMKNVLSVTRNGTRVRVKAY